MEGMLSLPLKGDLEGCNFKNIKLDTSSLDLL